MSALACRGWGVPECGQMIATGAWFGDVLLCESCYDRACLAFAEKLSEITEGDYDDDDEQPF